MGSEREKYYRRLNAQAEREAFFRRATVLLALLAALVAGIVWCFRRYPKAAWLTTAALCLVGGAWWLAQGGSRPSF